MFTLRNWRALIWAVSLGGVSGCSATPQQMESYRKNLDVITDAMFKKTQGRIKPEHLEACRKQHMATLGKVKLSGKPSYKRSRFYTCALSNQISSLLNPTEHYVVYVGKQPVAPDGIAGVQPGDHDLHIRLLCAYRVRADAVLLDNSLIPKSIDGGSPCQLARDAPPLIRRTTFTTVFYPVKR